jgi:transcriptional regulator with XRE-family HTH domain
MKTLQLTQLKAIRERHALTQETLAELSALSVRTIQRIESGGGASPDSATAITLALSLDNYAALMDTPSEPIQVLLSEKVTVGNPIDPDASQLSSGGMITLIFIALFFMFIHRIIPQDAGASWISVVPHFLMLINLIILMSIMVKIMKAIGVWTDVVNTFMSILGNAPVHHDHDETLPFGDIVKLMGVSLLFGASLFLSMPTITL